MTDNSLTDGGHCSEGEEDWVVEAPPVAVGVRQVVLLLELFLQLDVVEREVSSMMVWNENWTKLCR